MPKPTEHKTVQARILAYAEAILLRHPSSLKLRRTGGYVDVGRVGWTFVSQKAVFVSRLRRAKVCGGKSLNCVEHLNERDLILITRN